METERSHTDSVSRACRVRFQVETLEWRGLGSSALMDCRCGKVGWHSQTQQRRSPHPYHICSSGLLFRYSGFLNSVTLVSHCP